MQRILKCAWWCAGGQGRFYIMCYNPCGRKQTLNYSSTLVFMWAQWGWVCVRSQGGIRCCRAITHLSDHLHAERPVEHRASHGVNSGWRVRNFNSFRGHFELFCGSCKVCVQLISIHVQSNITLVKYMFFLLDFSQFFGRKHVYFGVNIFQFSPLFFLKYCTHS